MNIMLNFMEKIYSDTKTLSIIYIVGAVLLFIFIVLLIFSLRKSDKKEKPKIIEEPSDSKKEEQKEETKEIESKFEEKTEDISKEKEIKEEEINDKSIFEKTTIIPLDEIDTDSEALTKEENIEKALDNVENMKTIEKTDKPIDENISADIPDVDEFVDNVVKRTYEKNEQFSSVYVEDNDDTIKLDKVMDDLNVDSDVKEALVDTVTKEENIDDSSEKVIIEDVEDIETKAPTSINEPLEKEDKLANLKKALDGDKVDINLKQDKLKSKLDSLKSKSAEASSAEDLLKKLNSMKEK